MKIVINGKEKEITVLYGSHALFTYENICIQASIPFEKKPTITVKSKSVSLEIKPFGRVEIPVNEKPIFNVVVTSNA